ncbi:universal stress protein [Haloquadratum walsbyi]|jgi:nucleotide-binding universal stress UspA family protein|uniref:UspA domain protein n=2 Tax=Haloquadratum walsbyi TaxID=293091 RepID=Q18DQ0_HALWD|nr:universal stress protein [Haloquadratum walsbyi]CAJ51195.1 UspA domain protein [Haloquadratum walsbyi DSM 16790]
MTENRLLSVDLILAPIDASEESLDAVEYASVIAAKYDASVHVVHVLDEDIVQAIETGTVDKSAVATDGQTITESAETIAAKYDISASTSVVYGFSTQIKTTHPGRVVLDTAEDLNADFLVVPRKPLSGDPGEVLSRAAEYVLLYASQPVLSV